MTAVGGISFLVLELMADTRSAIDGHSIVIRIIPDASSCIRTNVSNHSAEGMHGSQPRLTTSTGSERTHGTVHRSMTNSQLSCASPAKMFLGIVADCGDSTKFLRGSLGSHDFLGEKYNDFVGD